jgi:SAM-dependent methyltransferase
MLWTVMDELARHNKERWEALAEANIEYSRPVLDLDASSALRMVDAEGVMGDVAGKDVLCLAGGGGQQSAAFGLLGARVTVLDLCETQLARDRQTAEHYGIQVATVHGDMRDLSCFGDDAFDLVWHAHSLTFVPDSRQVVGEVARVLRPGDRYRLHYTNPFVHGSMDSAWDEGYRINLPYVDGAEVTAADPCWDFEDGEGNRRRVAGPREFRHALGPLVNGLIARGFLILGLWEDMTGDAAAEPGSWAHFNAFMPPWLTIWAELRG